MLQQLLNMTPELADYIRNLVYNVTSDDLGNGSLVETFKKITRLKSFGVESHHSRLPRLQWGNNSLRPALLHLLHLPTLISFKMLFIDNFLFSDLAPCVNLKQLKFVHLALSDDEISTSNPPKKSIRLHDISAGLKSDAAVKKMCAMHCVDGKPFINFSCVNKLTVRLHKPTEVQASLDLLSRCKKLANVTLERFGLHKGDEWGRLDAALAQPGWPKLRQVSLAIVIWSKARANDDLECALKQLPQTQFPKLSSSKSLHSRFPLAKNEFEYRQFSNFFLCAGILTIF
ncbi:hypothetical protein BJ912DRAFT_1036711 [Pholiota molesta]|nr:hypothetical protein BJ912DRAFT_1036711 [Pholiota molesta]